MKLYLINHALLSVSEIDTLKSVLLKELPVLGIKSFFLSIYEPNDNKRQYCRIIAAYKDYKEINYKKEHEVYMSLDIIPDTLRNLGFGSTYIAMSLYYEDTQIGFVIYESDDINVTLYEILTMSLSNALRGIILRNKFINQNEDYSSINKDTMDKYQKSGLSNEKAEEYFKELINYMEREKVYINPDLTLPNLAEEINISRNHLSYIINKYAGLNFFDFINTYRIEEAKKIILNTQDNNMNILDIAFDSGFKSKSTFNKIFKKYTNKTPSDFRKENINKNKQL
jgi:AraC-like DNA-binding protein